MRQSRRCVKRVHIGLLLNLATLFVAGCQLCIADEASPDESAIAKLIESFRLLGHGNGSNPEIKSLLLENYVHVTPYGDLTSAWRMAPYSAERTDARVEQLHIRTFENAAVAAYTLRNPSREQATSSVMQVLVKRHGTWLIGATQVGGRNPAIPGPPEPIVDTRRSAPQNPDETEKEIRDTWLSFLDAIDRRTPEGGRVEDLDKARTIMAEDCLFVLGNGDLMSREQRYAQGHPNTTEVKGEAAHRTTSGGTLQHIDERVAVLDRVGIWTSRNPANGDQSMRVWLKREFGWQMIAVRHSMSVTPK